MMLTLKLTAVLIVGLATPLAVSGFIHESFWPRNSLVQPELATLSAGTFNYRAAGEFSRDGKPVDAPMMTVTIWKPLAMMRRQVTAEEYVRCVQDGGCQKLSHAPLGSDRPVVGVSWRDTQAYAVWLSRRTGEHFRLPTDEEWAYAAGTRFNDDTVPVASTADPSARWLAHYEQAARRGKPVEMTPQPIGTFGTNEHGLLDLAGNVWEWTATCFVRSPLEQDRAPTVNCGVRVVEGAHRTYMTDFVRDPKGGGCAVGIPPSNLGFRLVREPSTRR